MCERLFEKGDEASLWAWKQLVVCLPLQRTQTPDGKRAMKPKLGANEAKMLWSYSVNWGIINVKNRRVEV